jgi:streptogramin lyase
VCVAIADSGPRDLGVDGLSEVCVDGDGDGFIGATGCSTGDDCDDANPDVHPGVRELCGDSLDNDCDGSVDETECDCRPGAWIECYSGPATTRNVGLCHGGVGVCAGPGTTLACRGEVLPSVEDAAEQCDFLDNDCDGLVDEGLRNACGLCGAEPTELCGNDLDDDCDGLTDEDCNCDYRCVCATGEPCVCTPPTNQPCYEGPFATSGHGLCAGGRRDCVADPVSGATRWSACVGQVLPGVECAAGTGRNGVDDDCNGFIDDGCTDADGDTFPAPADCDDSNAAVHPGAAEVCNDRDDDCDGAVDEGVRNACGACGAPALTDTCGNGLDDDCNGLVDDHCSCSSGASQSCYGGPAGTVSVGSCVAGTQTCEGTEFTLWSACTGQVLPLPEICNGADDDCDGEVDERWAVGSNRCGFCSSVEVCDGMDNDCDGLVDEGVANRCGECAAEPVEVCNGADDDCDGVIDDGVTNACGTCPPAPCYEVGWGTPADCTAAGRSCTGLEEHPDYPGSITLGQATFENNHIYIAVTDRNQVAQLDTDTGVKNWQVPSYGTYPSRTAVALDGSVWVTNRGFGNPADVNQSNIVHLAIDGSLICRAPVINIARSAAIDAEGNVWAGEYNTGYVWKISGSLVDTSTSPPTCVVIRGDSATGVLATGVNIYGLAADGNGNVWTASGPPSTIRINTTTYAMTTITNPGHYGVAPAADGRVWFGGWSGGVNVHAINPDGSVFMTSVGAGEITAVTVHPDGSIWGSGYGSNSIIKIDPTTGAELCRASIPGGIGTNPHGIAVDRLGRLWMPVYSAGYVTVWNPDCSFVATYPVDPGYTLYSYSDMTGHLLRTVTTREGIWMQDFDSGYDGASWARVEWDSIVPADTGVEITAWSAPTRAGLGTGAPCGPFTTSPADLTTCGFLSGNRHLRVQVRLTTARSGIRPIVRNVRAFWAY